ncbi:glycosyltransferase [Escherichia coli]|nr:glycosyltransferase [Escherichia coli]
MPDANIAIVPNGFCSESYEQNNTEDLRQKLNIDANDTVLLFRRISPDKGCLMLMEAFNQLNKIQDNLKLVIVGDPLPVKKAKKLNIRKSSGCSESY